MKIGKAVKLKNGFEGVVINELHHGHKDIRPPYTLNGGFVVKGINGSLGCITILPPTINEILYDNEVLYSSIASEEDIKRNDGATVPKHLMR